jgi:cell division protein FtsQ
MHQRISKKILIYLFIFFFLGTLNNKDIINYRLPKINNFEITGLTEYEEDQINKDLIVFQNQNLFFLKGNRISEKINSLKIVEKLYIFKNYPSSLNIKIKKTNFIAITKKNDLNFYIGSNGNLIKVKNKTLDLPFIFGNVEVENFLKLKKIIDNSDIDYKDIKSFYYFESSRWDIETKDNLIIKLPITNMNNSFEILLKIYKNNRFKDIKLIDLRQNKQVILDG